MMKRFYLFLMGVLILLTSTNAQSLKGKVIDETNLPLACKCCFADLRLHFCGRYDNGLEWNL